MKSCTKCGCDLGACSAAKKYCLVCKRAVRAAREQSRRDSRPKHTKIHTCATCGTDISQYKCSKKNCDNCTRVLCNAKRKQQRLDNPEQLREYGRKRYAENIETFREYGRTWYAKNREKIRARAQEQYYRDVNKSREHIRIKAAKHRAENPERFTAYANDFRKRRPDLYAKCSAKTILKKGGLENPPAELVELKTAYLLVLRKTKELTK